MILLSSFYNEEYLLPWWCMHHKNIFKHAVLFDYYSTDKSVDIIKEICPTWEVRQTKNKDWNFADNDREYMEAEREFSDDYKIVLTTTEFLMSYPRKFPDEKTVFAIPMIRMIDNESYNIPTYDLPLVVQKDRGFVSPVNKYRFLHNYSDGQYSIGRHKTKHQITKKCCFIYKYVFSPWTEEFIQRKLSMKKHMNYSDIESGKGKHHTWDREKLFEKYNRALKNFEYYEQKN